MRFCVAAGVLSGRDDPALHVRQRVPAARTLQRGTNRTANLCTIMALAAERGGFNAAQPQPLHAHHIPLSLAHCVLTNISAAFVMTRWPTCWRSTTTGHACMTRQCSPPAACPAPPSSVRSSPLRNFYLNMPSSAEGCHIPLTRTCTMYLCMPADFSDVFVEREYSEETARLLSPSLKVSDSPARKYTEYRVG